jgi:hypothetical protein
MTTDDLESTTAIRGSLLELDREHKSIYNPRTPKVPEIDDTKVSVDRTVSERFFGTVAENADMFQAKIGADMFVVMPQHKTRGDLFIKAFRAMPRAPAYQDFQTCLLASDIVSTCNLPNLRGMKHYAGLAVSVVCRREGLSSAAEQGTRVRGYKARYHLGTKSGLNGEGVVGDSYGTRSCIVTLHDDGTISWTGNDLTGQDVQSEYCAGINGQTYTSAQRIEWGQDILRVVFNAKVALFTELMPISSCPAMAVGLANGLIAEVAKIRAGIDGQIRHAEKRGAVLGKTAALNAIKALGAVADSAHELGTLLNGEPLKRVVRDAKVLIAFLDRYCDSTSVYGAMVWAEIELND